MLEHPSDRCSCSAQVVRAHLAPPGRTVIDSRHRCEVRTRPSILGPIVEFWAHAPGTAVAERVGALSQWGRTITRRGRLHIGTLHQREPISHAQHKSPWRPHRVLHAGGTAGCGQCSTMRQGRIGRGSSITVRVELSFQSSASKSRLAAQRLDIEMASRRMLAQRRADQRQERCTSTSPTRYYWLCLAA